MNEGYLFKKKNIQPNFRSRQMMKLNQTTATDARQQRWAAACSDGRTDGRTDRWTENLCEVQYPQQRRQTMKASMVEVAIDLDRSVDA